jgi:hypothetical protein
VVDNAIISPLLLYGHRTVHYDQFQAPSPGFYIGRATVCQEATERLGYEEANCRFHVGETGPQYPNTLKLWSGDNGKGNPNEMLCISRKTGHDIVVQVEGDDHDAQVSFESSDSRLTFEYDGMDSIGRPQQQITVDGQIIYVAKTWVKLPDEIPVSGSSLPWVVKASQPEALSPVYITVYSITDGEKSHNIEPYSHQTNVSGEIPGDNYICVLDNQGNQVIDPGFSSDYKDIMIELDWYKWDDYVDTTTIKEIANFIKKVLYTAGIDTVNSIFIGDEITTMPDSTTRQQRMGMLFENKDSLTTEQRIWLNKIHVILGSKGEKGHMGINELYPPSDDTFNFWQTMHLGSGEIEFSSPFLDSVGCFVFVDRILEYPGRQLELNRAIALVTAHEIGHALGMWHYPDWNEDHHIMIESFATPFMMLAGFDQYGRFASKTLDGSYDVNNYASDGMNTRNILGINCVNSIYE